MTADDRARPKTQIALADLRIGMAQRMPLLSQTRRIASLARRLTTLLPSRGTNTASTPRRCRPQIPIRIACRSPRAPAQPTQRP